jgi:hypothetical protein
MRTWNSPEKPNEEALMLNKGTKKVFQKGLTKELYGGATPKRTRATKIIGNLTHPKNIEKVWLILRSVCAFVFCVGRL